MFLVLPFTSTPALLVPTATTPATSVDTLSTRRTALCRAAAALTTVGLTTRRAAAFDNRLPKDELELKYKTPRTPGPKPTDLGPRAGGGLKSCTDGKPHCFSSTPEVFDDNDLYQADYGTTEGWFVQPFRYDKPLADALAELKDVLASYPPGQGGIDGGGFKLAAETTGSDAAYLYVLFESRRKGYVDDVEFSLAKGVCNVRTSSRLGYLDYGECRRPSPPLSSETRPHVASRRCALRCQRQAVQLVQQHAGGEAWLDGHADPLQGPRGVLFAQRRDGQGRREREPRRRRQAGREGQAGGQREVRDGRRVVLLYLNTL